MSFAPTNWPAALRVTRPNHSQQISFPYAGIGGPERALYACKFKFTPVNEFDKEQCCIRALHALHGSRQHDSRCLDILESTDADWQDSDGLVGGPPCLPWTVLGSTRGWHDPRSDCFVNLLERIREMSLRKRPLLWAVIENVESLMWAVNGTRGINKIIDWWHENMPHWEPLDVMVVDSRDCGLPQSRRRVFMVSVSKMVSHVAGMVPEEPAKLTKVKLEPFLSDGRGAGSREKPLTAKLQANIDYYNATFSSLQAKDATGAKFACVNVSRAPGEKFKASFKYDECPTVTFSSRYMYVLKKSGIVSDKVPSIGRFATLEDLCNVSGVSFASLSDVLTKTQMYHALANVITPNAAGVVLASVMKTMAIFETNVIKRDLFSLMTFIEDKTVASIQRKKRHADEMH